MEKPRPNRQNVDGSPVLNRHRVCPGMQFCLANSAHSRPWKIKNLETQLRAQIILAPARFTVKQFDIKD